MDDYKKIGDAAIDQSFYGLMTESPYMKLNNVFRYSNKRLIERESTAQHTIQCQLICLWICDQLKDLNISINEKLVCYKALTHDLDECVSCDIPRNIKYHDLDTLKKINDISDELLVASGMPETRIKDIHDSKHDGTLEGYIVALVDIIQAYTKIEQEYLLQKSTDTLRLMYEALGNLHNRIIEFYDKIDPVVEIFFTQLLKDMIIHSNTITGLNCPYYEGRSEIMNSVIDSLNKE